jgi:hypothetical protein
MKRIKQKIPATASARSSRRKISRREKFLKAATAILAFSFVSQCSTAEAQATPHPVIGQSCPSGALGTTQLSGNLQEGVIQCIPDGNGNYIWQAEGGVARYDSTGGCSVAGTLRWNGSAMQYCDGGNWQNFGSVPSGTICGMQTNGDNFGARCEGYSPYDSQCPPGYWLNVWRVSFGNGWFMFCVKD